MLMLHVTLEHTFVSKASYFASHHSKPPIAAHGCNSTACRTCAVHTSTEKAVLLYLGPRLTISILSNSLKPKTVFRFFLSAALPKLLKRKQDSSTLYANWNKKLQSISFCTMVTNLMNKLDENCYCRYQDTTNEVKV